MKRPDSKKLKGENPAVVSPTSRVWEHCQPELKAIEKSWQTLLALKRQQEKAFQQMLESYDELDKEITKLESREESILSRMAKQEKKTPGNQESKPLLGRSHSQKLNDLTLEPVAYWRKKLSENKKARRPRLPDILRILEMKRKHPSLGATAIYARLHPTLRKGEWNRTGKRMQEVRQIQKILDWYAK